MDDTRQARFDEQRLTPDDARWYLGNEIAHWINGGEPCFDLMRDMVAVLKAHPAPAE